MSVTVRMDISLFSLSEEFDNPLFFVPLTITLQTIRKHIKETVASHFLKLYRIKCSLSASL